MRGVQRGDLLADLGTEHPGKRGRQEFDQHDFDIHRACTRRDLAADEAGPDHRKSTCPSTSSPRSRSASSRVRSTCTLVASAKIGSWRGTAPVAMTSGRRRHRSRLRAPRSWRRCRPKRPRRPGADQDQARRSFPGAAGTTGRSPRSTSLDSGGRSYGWCFSAPIKRDRAGVAHPSKRLGYAQATQTGPDDDHMRRVVPRCIDRVQPSQLHPALTSSSYCPRPHMPGRPFCHPGNRLPAASLR